MSEMTAIEIARRLAELGQAEEACRAYILAINESSGESPDEEMEAALYILQFQGDYRIPYTRFVDLYRRGCYREDCLNILQEAFYFPNERELKERYERNCRALRKYPFLFRTDFVPFEELPIRFFPYDDKGYFPFHVEEGRFDEYTDFDTAVVSRNFFADLEKPVLAADLYSQYELEYLNDNVRPSEWVGRDNHIYLHYTDWAEFCAYLQVLEFKKLLKGKKLVFLAESQVEQYPIDFRERFQLDYSQYPVKPVGIREVQRLIWHTQLSTHNGGDFFNEVFDAHPNLLYMSSMMFYEVEETVAGIREDLKQLHSLKEAQEAFAHWKDPGLVEEFYHLKNLTDKDILVTLFFAAHSSPCLDKNSRIAPALFFQPHFHNIHYSMNVGSRGNTELQSEEYDKICRAKLFKGFRYIKTFTPMRRFTTSCAAGMKFMYWGFKTRNWTPDMEEPPNVIGNLTGYYVMNRSFMIDRENPLFRDCVLVRFEDGKLNSKATFTALAAFLDLPYTESMTYCSIGGSKDTYVLGNVRGFDPASVYRTYDEFTGFNERYFLEYFLRDAYEFYGYDFHYYDNAPVDDARIEELVDGFDVTYGHNRESYLEAVRFHTLKQKNWEPLTPEEDEELKRKVEEDIRGSARSLALHAQILQRQLRFVNKRGVPLEMMPRLQLDPDLLEQPLYH